MFIVSPLSILVDFLKLYFLVVIFKLDLYHKKESFTHRNLFLFIF